MMFHSVHKSFFHAHLLLILWIRFCFQPIGTSRAEAVPCFSSIEWHQRHKPWDWHRWASTKNSVQSDLQNEENMGTSDVGHIFRLGPYMLQQSPAISFAVLVARTSLYWLMVTTKYCDISRATSIFHAANVWGWRGQAGKCSIMKGLPWVLQKWRDSGRKKERSLGR